MRLSRPIALLAAAASVALLAGPAAPAGAAKPPKSPYAYTVSDFPYPAPSIGLTAIDPEYETLYLLDRDEHVYLVDSTTGAVRATVDGVDGNSIAVDIASHVAYVNYVGQLIAINRDGSARQVGDRLGSDITGIAVDPRTHEIYGADTNDGTVNVMAATGGEVTTIPVGGQPYEIAIDDPGRRAYVTNFQNGSVSVIDLDTHAVVATIGVGPRPYDVAVDTVTHRAYVGLASESNIRVIDASTNGVVDSIATPFDAVTRIDVDPVTHTAYALSDVASVAAIDLTSKAVTTIPTPQTAYETAVDPIRHTALVIEAASPEDASIQKITQLVKQKAVITRLSATSGGTAGGEQITITGDHFAGATKVLFGTTPATSFTVQSDERIVATVPSRKAGKVPVRVKTVGLSAPGRTSRYTYLAPSSPTA